jgi:hypothetical protein
MVPLAGSVVKNILPENPNPADRPRRRSSSLPPKGVARYVFAVTLFRNSFI